MASLVNLQTSLVSIVVVVAAAIYFSSTRLSDSSPPLTRVAVVLNTHLAARELYHQKHKPCSTQKHVGIGYVGNVDLIVNAQRLFRAMIDRHALHPDVFTPRVHSKVNDAQQLGETFSAFFSQGSAVEKFCPNATFFRTVVAAAEASHGASFALGGNAAIMATRLASVGCPVFLGSYAGSQMKKLLHANIRLADPSLASPEDDVHLIIEYGKGELFSSDAALASPRANRFILTQEMERVLPVAQLAASVTALQSQVGAVILSGFHLFDGQPSEARTNKLVEVSQFLKSLPADIISHFELASMSEAQLYADVAKHVLPYSSSMGANEQEIAALHDVLHGRPLNSAGYGAFPSVGSVVPKIVQIMQKIPLTRVHVHSLVFQAICQVSSGRWPDPSYSLLEATMTSLIQACSEVNIEMDDHHC